MTPSAATVVCYEAHRRQAAHAHDNASVSIVIRGGLAETAQGRTVEASLGSAVVKPAGIVHDDRFGPEGAELVFIPANSVSAPRWQWLWDRRLAALGVGIAVALRDKDRFGAAEECVWEVHGIVAGFDDGHERARPPPWVARMRDAIEAHATRPSLTELAACAGVHPVHAGRVFRRSYGLSVSEFAATCRVQRAISLLSRSDRTIADIAASLGFADQSHLCRVFRSTMGVTPSRYRALRGPASPRA